MSIFETLGLVAGLIQIVGYAWYVSYVLKGQIKPNAASWIIWSYGNAVVCWSYIVGGEQITFKESLPIVCSILCILSTCLFLFLGKFEKPKKYEILILVADILITLYWIVTGENKIAHILIQVSVAISFFPIIKETLADPSEEKSGPWFVWSIAYLFLFFAEYSQDFWMWIYPLQYLIWHAVMGIISTKPRPSRV